MVLKREPSWDFKYPLLLLLSLLSIHGISVLYMMDFASDIYRNGLQFLPIYGFERGTIMGFQIAIIVIIEFNFHSWYFCILHDGTFLLIYTQVVYHCFPFMFFKGEPLTSFK